jgi:hypothetical protein
MSKARDLAVLRQVDIFLKIRRTEVVRIGRGVDKAMAARKDSPQSRHERIKLLQEEYYKEAREGTLTSTDIERFIYQAKKLGLNSLRELDAWMPGENQW